MPTRVTRWSASQSASAPRSAVIAENFRLLTRQPPSGLGTRTQATSEAFAMSSPAARSTTVSIVMTLLLARTATGAVADWVGAVSIRAFDSRVRSNTPGHQPRLPRPVPKRARSTKVRKRRQDRSATIGIFGPPGRPDGLDRSEDHEHTAD